MCKKLLQASLIVLSAIAVWAACADVSFARLFGHHRYPTGNSPTYLNATPHGGFSISNGYYSGRSRIVDAPPAPVRPAPAK
jgi:hypothetical protein